jgi:hypothetical protein
MSPGSSSAQSVIAVAGRRIDGSNVYPPRFPSANAETVRVSVLRTLEETAVKLLIASAACGSDLLALDAASEFNIRFRIVLPFAPKIFRQSSVVDRAQPDYWGTLYDRLITEAGERGDLIILDRNRDDPRAYVAANGAIIAEALSAAEKAVPPARLLAVIVWEGRSRSKDDVTDDFRRIALENGFSIKQISTLAPFD